MLWRAAETDDSSRHAHHTALARHGLVILDSARRWMGSAAGTQLAARHVHGVQISTRARWPVALRIRGGLRLPDRAALDFQPDPLADLAREYAVSGWSVSPAAANGSLYHGRFDGCDFTDLVANSRGVRTPLELDSKCTP